MSGFLSNGIKPSLVHGVEVEIQRVNLAGTTWDPVYREASVPAGKAYSAAVKLFAQVHYKNMDDLVPSPGGDDGDAYGHLTFLREDLDALSGGYFKKGDKIVKIDGRDLGSDALFILQQFNAGHYGTHTLVKFFFSQRDKATEDFKAATKGGSR